MEIKDILALSISALAFILSVSATIVSLVRSKNEKQRTIRNELSTVLSEITSIEIENAKLLQNHNTYSEDTKKISQILSQRNAFLIQQSIYLAEQIPNLVTGVEYNTIASANLSSGDVLTAEIYFLKAVDSAKNNYNKSLALSSYAKFLFFQLRFEEGRKFYTDATNLLSEDNDMNHFANGSTYLNWAADELRFAKSLDRSNDLFKIAENEFSKIQNSIAKEKAIDDLRRAKSQQHPKF